MVSSVRLAGLVVGIYVWSGCSDGTGGSPSVTPSATPQVTGVVDPTASPTISPGTSTPRPTEAPTQPQASTETVDPTVVQTTDPGEPSEVDTEAPTSMPSAEPSPAQSPTAEAVTSRITDPPSPTPAHVSDTEPASPTTTQDHDGDGVVSADDCDDNNGDAYPGNSEGCDAVDNDCDGDVDENVETAPLWYADADDDGFGADAYTTTACQAPDGYVAQGGDCDDRNPSFNPSALEPNCTDPNDYNCDGSTGYADGDEDGYAACEDCDDADTGISPGAKEQCDGIDNDCDSHIDGDDPDLQGAPVWYQDLDEDGFGNPEVERPACTRPDGYVANEEDCDDSNTSVNPDSVWYGDYDGDGHGGTAFTITICLPPSGFVASHDDCNDTSPLFYPGATEDDCGDPNDYNCDGSVAYVDGDGDGFGACEECDDKLASVNPAAQEKCNSVDDDCDGTVDDGVTVTYYADDDQDGYGDQTDVVQACAAPTGYVQVNGDCNDTTSVIHPGAQELPNGVDDDCDGAADDNAIYPSCRAIHAALPNLTTGYYPIDPDGLGSGVSFSVYCDMTTDGGGWTRFWWLRDNLANAAADPYGQDLSTCVATGTRCLGRIPTGVSPSDLMVKDVQEGHFALWHFASTNAVSNAVLSAVRDHATACLVNSGVLWQPYLTNDSTGEAWCGAGGEGGCDSFHYQFNNTCTTYRVDAGWATELDGDGGCYAAAWKVGVGQVGYPECSTPDQNFLDDGPSTTDDPYGEMYYR